MPKAYLQCSRGAICLKYNSRDMFYESWLVLSFEPYLLNFIVNLKCMKGFFLETCPFDNSGAVQTFFR